jgi:hypothetical protein
VSSALEGDRLSAIRTGRLYPMNTLVLILRGRDDPVHMVLSDATGKIPIDTTGDRSRDLPSRSVVPWPLRQPRPHDNTYYHISISKIIQFKYYLAVNTLLLQYGDESVNAAERETLNLVSYNRCLRPAPNKYLPQKRSHSLWDPPSLLFMITWERFWS